MKIGARKAFFNSSFHHSLWPNPGISKETVYEAKAKGEKMNSSKAVKKAKEAAEQK